jgi:glycosyltransferase involved in cell wall biosynthesis
MITSPADKAALERLSGSAPSDHIVVVPNGVDLTYFQPGAVERQAADIVFSGRMSYHANVSAAVFFARQVMPLIWERLPQATFTIAGYDPVPEVRLLANNPRIIVTGTVDDVRPYIQSATVAVAPMPYGTGIQNKILEAMACRTAVVTSPQPLAALQAVAGEDVLVASSAAEFAQQTLSLLEDADLRQRIAAAGRRYVEQRHNWSSIVDQLESIYRDAIARHGEAQHG